MSAWNDSVAAEAEAERRGRSRNWMIEHVLELWLRRLETIRKAKAERAAKRARKAGAK